MRRGWNVITKTMSNMIQDIGAIPVLIMKIMAVNKVIQKQGLSIKSLLPSYTGHKDFEKRTDVIIKTMSNIIQDVSATPQKSMEIIQHLVTLARQPASKTMSPYHHFPPDEFPSS